MSTIERALKVILEAKAAQIGGKQPGIGDGGERQDNADENARCRPRGNDGSEFAAVF